MKINLRLHFLDSNGLEQLTSSNDTLIVPDGQLNLVQDQTLFAAIQKIQSIPFPEGAAIYAETNDENLMGFISTDGLDQRLVYTNAADWEEACAISTVSDWNLAVLTFIRSLPKQNLIVLEWF